MNDFLNFNTAPTGHAAPEAREDPRVAVDRFHQAAAELGLVIRGEPMVTDDVVRVPTREDRGREATGWYVLHLDDGILYGALGDWRSGVTRSFCSRESWRITPELDAKIRRRQEEAEIRKEAARKEAAERSEAIAERAPPASAAHPYLVKKGVAPHGIGQMGLDLVIPIRDLDGRVISHQTIAPDGTKLYAKGGNPIGVYVIGDKTDKPAVLCEGWATGASIHEATGLQVYVCFSANGLKKLAGAIHSRVGAVIVAGDNDASGAGQQAAYEAAQAAGGARVLLPETVGEDWNDLALRDQELVRRAFVMPAAEPPRQTTGLTHFDDVEVDRGANYIVKGLLQRNALTVLYGPSNSGKTFIALDMVYAVASGEPRWRGRRVKGGPVLYIAAEGGSGIKARIAALKERHRVDGVNLFVRAGSIDLYTPGSADPANIARWCDEIRQTTGEAVVLVIIDTLSRAMPGGDENDVVDMTRFVRTCDGLRAVTGAHVLVIHHTGKNTSAGARGHSSLRAAVDTEIEIEVEEEVGLGITRTFRVTKQRDLAIPDPWNFELEVVDLGVDVDGDAINSCVVKHHDPVRATTSTARIRPLTRGAEEALEALCSAFGKREHVDRKIWTEELMLLRSCDRSAASSMISKAVPLLLAGSYISDEGGIFVPNRGLP